MKDKNTFFSQANCDRCGKGLGMGPRQLSWFTEECLCSECMDKEKEVKQALEKAGVNVANLEGCGHVPKI